ncbi:1-aminocyclopropane-1-carboxylate deaminase/D-cysteine desulfhydrase [Mucilaginibacter sp. KACC 22063]|uniref:1-aminocyclopropane-1-carboxylate deaminase/D-cysteine desulfhydrase n=1 Tax=Mucilaginibacter sp. KACC 22063 TaxID=3025666 RepID=UPI0023663C62|nr:pyridoxal-phosphate dependent enzyme [Mucilaginibacter sp. KACC 22063]WDF56879.1 pyridoxal-phosphate dependent enzyme [Mucilaginibacter sp. KACC 22063]
MVFDLEIFSPVQQIRHPLFDEKGLKVFVKRDDMIHPVISGNKWRKLKYLLAEANKGGENHLVTFGGAYSNHLLATSAAAATFGFKSTGFVRGEDIHNDSLMLCRMHGMELIFVDRESYRNKPALFDKHFGNDDNAFYIDEGGASEAAARGCSELMDELPQIFDHIFCACGTGTTAAGILNGIITHQLTTILHAVPVLKNGGFIGDEIRNYAIDPNANFELHLDYHFGGYAKTTPQLISFVKDFVAQTGILIEPVYTGKMFYALFDQVRKNMFKPGSSLLAIHTGGIMGLFGMRDKFNK